MIVRADADGLLTLITQPDHAALSAELMAAWATDGLPARSSRATILLATREHDNGWKEVDDRPGVDGNGRPFEFTNAPIAVRQPIWPRGIARLASRSPLAAALVAEHALTVYGRYRGDPLWSRFFAEIAVLRDTLLHQIGALDGAERQAFESDYRFVFLGDLLSLVFCNRWRGTFDARGYRFWLDGDALRIWPDPFGGKPIPFGVPARRIANRRYESDEDLRETLAGTPVVSLAGTAAAASPGAPVSS